jgi:tRNA modification GTPase
MAYDLHDTIAAIATARGNAARGAVRISGPQAVRCAFDVFTAVDGVCWNELSRPTTLTGHAQIVLTARPAAIPCDLLVWPRMRSYTRQPLAEFHLLGAPVILDALLERLCATGARLAEPGEFTLRAFLAGRIDLTQAEAVLGVIDAHSTAEYSTALVQLAGGLAAPLGELRLDLLHLLAELEAGLDFVDEDIEFISRAEIATRLADAHHAVSAIERQLADRRNSPTEFEVVLVGPPNVGKSSLFNALVEQYGLQDRNRVAIVSPISGTTRDYLLAELELGGLHCQLIDTAGFVDDTFEHSAASAEIHRAAQSHASARRRGATLRLLCSDDRFALKSIQQPTLFVVTKADLASDPEELAATDSADTTCPVIVTSSRTGQGLAELADAIRTQLGGSEPAASGTAVATTANRCHESVRVASQSLATAHELAQGDCGDELIAAEVRSALNELGKVVGAVSTDDLLDRIFSSFCIGK